MIHVLLYYNDIGSTLLLRCYCVIHIALLLRNRDVIKIHCGEVIKTPTLLHNNYVFIIT